MRACLIVSDDSHHKWNVELQYRARNCSRIRLDDAANCPHYIQITDIIPSIILYA